MELPHTLAPWGSYLAVFPRDLALSLGPVLQRLSSAVGPLQVRRLDGGGELDGYDGIDRHGSYERLLATEWLLADEMPDEFLRRAVMGEHLFLHANRPEPGGHRTSVAIFDAGPGQLGSPRIAQLAVLIVLARRAEAAGARFAWGILQDPEAPLHSEVTETGILRLLQSRTPHEASDAQIGAWHARIRGWKETDDLWIIGPPRLGSLPAARGASVLQVWDVLDPESRRVAVRVRPGGQAARELSLDLPEDAACARLLRDPFAAATTPPRRLDPWLKPASNLVFSTGGTKLFARAAGGGLVVFSIPNSPRAVAGAPRACDPWPGEVAVAAGVRGKKILLATCRDGAIDLHEISRQGSPALAATYAPALEGRGFSLPWLREREPLQPLLGTAPHLWVQDGSGRLFQLGGASHPGQLRELLTATAAAVSSGTLFAVEPAGGGHPARLLRCAGDRQPEIIRELPGPGRHAFFGYSGRPLHVDHGLLALDLDGEGSWQILSRSGDWSLTPAAGARVAGAGRDPRQPDSPGLLLLDEDGRSLLLAGPGWTRRVASASAEIEQVTVDHASPRFAFATAAGEVVVGTFGHDRPLFRLFPEEVS